MSRNKTDEDYLIAGRDRSWYQVLLSKFAVSVGVGWFISYTAYAYEFGFAMVGFIVGTILGYSLFTFWVIPKVYNFSREKGIYTNGDIVELSVKSKKSRYLFDLVLVGIQFLWLLISFVGGSQIISTFGLVSYELALLLTSIIIFFYLLIGGFKAVMLTDVIQSVIIIFLLVLVTQNIVSGESISNIISTQTMSLSLGDLVGFLIFGIFSAVVYSDRYQIVFAAKDQKNAQWGFLGALVPILITAGLLVIIGLFMRMQSIEFDPSLVFVQAISNFLSPSILLLAIVVFFAGLMSSADSYIYAITSQIVFAHEGLKKRKVKYTKYLMGMVIIISALVSYFVRDIIDITVFAAGLSLVPSMSLIYLFWGNKDKTELIFNNTLISGGLGLMIGVVVFGLEPVIAVIPILGGCVGLLSSYIYVKVNG